MDGYTLWCSWHGVSHGHCPLGCEHPQPVMLDDARVVCGRCLIVDRTITPIVPCTQDVCD